MPINKPLEDGELLAAIDLGSNSFHMIVARIVNGHVQVLDRLREMVQLAAGLDGRNRLSADRSSGLWNAWHASVRDCATFHRRAYASAV